jgi:NADH-quinone oxidoreductase subunit N
MIGALEFQAATVADLTLIAPELILTVTSLGLLLGARKIGYGSVATLATVLAAIAAVVTLGWILPRESESAFGGMLVLDGYARFFKILILCALIFVALVSKKSVQAIRAPLAEYNTLLLLASTGVMLAVSAQDLLSLYLGLELLTLCSFVLVGIALEKPASNEAAIKYFLLGSFASALMLFGISLVYGLTGTTDIREVAATLSQGGVEQEPLAIAAVGLVVAGLAFKVAAVPFHAWAPDAYQGALTPVAAFLATASKAAGLAVMGRVFLVAFESQTEIVSAILIALAASSILVGSVFAATQTNMKRLLAYSSIAHAGYALLGLVAGTEEGVSATMLYVFFYVFMTLGAFTVIIGLEKRGEELDGYEGLAAQRPVTAALMLLFLLSLTGIPPTAGFAAKFAVILSILREGHVLLAVLAVICSVISAFVYLRIAVLMYMKEPSKSAPARIPFVLVAALALAAAITLVGGIFPGEVAIWAVAP